MPHVHSGSFEQSDMTIIHCTFCPFALFDQVYNRTKPYYLYHFKINNQAFLLQTVTVRKKVTFKIWNNPCTIVSMFFPLPEISLVQINSILRLSLPENIHNLWKQQKHVFLSQGGNEE